MGAAWGTPTPAKLALASALKDALATTPLAKVTVSGLAAAAGVNRQTFYAHFADVYDLAAWVFKTEIADHVMAHASYDDWADGFVRLLGYLQDHREQAFAVIRSLKHAELERFFYDTLRAMMAVIVAELEGELDLSASDRDFIIDHYTLAVVGHLQHWLSSGMAANPYVLVSNLESLMRGQVRSSLVRLAARAST